MSCQCNHTKESETERPEDALITSTDPSHPANLICELCRLFYSNGWVTGTGGGISIRSSNLIYIAPSGVQKERMIPENMFVMDLETKEYKRTPKVYKPSACTPLFLSAYTMRNAGACIHTHSQAAVMVSLLYEKEFKIANIEQIKALPKVTEPGYLGFFDTLTIPIIENTAHEEDLTDALQQAIKEYPGTTAVLVRRHGIYVWGETVWKAKVYNEAIDYLLELAVEMKSFGIPPHIDIGQESKYVDPKIYN
ncbi:CYFA0S12e01992g1_1 [Cyberlindnera fabianii]|uniref:Methylthioribulose-1-phosphate dehydratase n=1 Tax=Cyberlindnera fabianii TaxID=36022 RepID=A0A061B6R3_CYBFA|nr:Methylthioribulose-1-phosphate dehydratase [Cyberlindnera fabianii]CDR43572.1 CYFA0S12e01992g1_1 [Cyberlindnera fabianii]